MAEKWTEDQQRVIDLRNKDILVSAAAGSGKTAVLVERIIKRITDEEHPVDIDRLLVVTFTKAAAAEMRERVTAAIEQKRQEDPANLNLMRQSALIHNALITTIDSFCLYVVRNHFEEINLDPNFRIADEGEIRLLEEDVISEVFEQQYLLAKTGACTDFLTLVDAYSGKHGDGAVKEMVSKIYRLSSSSPWPKEWIAGLCEIYEAATTEELEQSAVCKEIVRHAALLLSDLAEQSKRIYALTTEPDGPAAYEPAFRADYEMLEDFVQKASEGASFFSLGEMLRQATFMRLGTVKKGSCDENKKEQAKNRRDKIKDAFAELRDAYFPVDTAALLEQLKRIRPFAKELVRLALCYADAMDARKRKKRMMDFGDIEHFALRILVDEKTKECTPTAQEFAAHLEEIMIDEYQDSNMVQETILTAIARHGDGCHNLFMVGDVKQSIYRFRLAKPELFMEKYRLYEEATENRERIDLHRNFRSRREVLDFTNDMFYKLMHKSLGKVDYDDAAALYPGAGYDANANMQAELLLFDQSQLGGQEENSGDDKKELEARMIASRIKRLMAETTVTDKKSGAQRPMRYSDIVILLRSLKDWGQTFAEVLEDFGIPVHVEASTGYFSAIEVQTVLNFLRILDNPYQDIPMAAVLHSPLVGLSEEELAEIAAGAKEHSFAEAALLAMQSADEDDVLARFYQCYLQLRAAKELPIHELLLRIYSVTGYANYVAALPAGKQRLANLNMLVEKAVAYEQTSYKGLFHFVRYIDHLKKYDVDFGEAEIMGENADVVHIMTIHKSKGLEFPVVFVSGTAKQINQMDAKEKLVLHEELGFGIDEIELSPKRKRSCMVRSVIADYLRREALGEELRVLYVALTRAREKLIVTGVVSNADKLMQTYAGNCLDKEPLAYLQRAKAACYLDWIIPAMLSYPDKYTVDFVGVEALLAESAKEAANQQIAYAALLDRIAEVPEESLDEIRASFAYEYPYLSETNKKVKYSVSELKHASMVQHMDRLEEAAELPNFLLEDKESYIPDFAREESADAGAVFGVNRGALRGTAVHRVMECLNFAEICSLPENDAASAERFVESELLRMCDSGELTASMRELVRPEIIVRFVQSSVARRMAVAAKNQVLYKEKPFVMMHENVLVQGIVDVFWMEGDDIVLLDYKTDRVRSSEELVLRYKTQLDLYADALTRIFSNGSHERQAKERLIYSFCLGEEVAL